MTKGEFKMKSLLTVFVLGIISVVFAGCCSGGKFPIFGNSDDKAECSIKVKAVICGCGEIKGSANCCKKDAIKCSKCGLNKGSIACCKKNLTGKEICLKCGEIKCSTNCCKQDAVKCSKCGLNKGSIGCCNPIIGRMIEDEL